MISSLPPGAQSFGAPLSTRGGFQRCPPSLPRASREFPHCPPSQRPLADSPFVHPSPPKISSMPIFSNTHGDSFRYPPKAPRGFLVILTRPHKSPPRQSPEDSPRIPPKIPPSILLMSVQSSLQTAGLRIAGLRGLHDCGLRGG